MQNLGIIIKRNHPQALTSGRRLAEWLSARGYGLLCEADLAAVISAPPFSKAEIADQADLIIVLGGDGTLLSIARHIERPDLPVLGVNLGGLGFLTEITLGELFTTLDEVLAGDFTISPRMILKVSLCQCNQETKHFQVLNDVVINKGAMARIIDLETVIDNRLVNNFRADGLIFSTPTGSTGYSLSAGGPIVYPTMDSIIIAPICPHMLSNRPLIVPPEVTIQTSLNSTENDDVFVTLDGQSGFAFKPGDRLIITRAEQRLNLIASPNRTYFAVLRSKLKWGERYEREKTPC